MNVPPLQSLHTLAVLSRHSRIGPAAVELGLSHAAVSQTVSRLEKQLSVQLFLRNRWGVQATPQCRELVDAYLSASSTLTKAVEGASQGRRFRILLPKSAWFWLSPAVARLYRRTPDLRFDVYQDDAVDLNAADFAIVPGGHAPPAGFDGRALYDERLIPVCAPAFASAAKIESLAGLSLAQLLIADRDLWLRWFSHAGFAAEPRVVGPLFADATLAMDAALRGQGVALCCTVAVAEAMARGDLVAPAPVSMPTGRRFWAVWRAGLAPARQVLDWLLAELDARTSALVPPDEEGVRDLAESWLRDREPAWVKDADPWASLDNSHEVGRAAVGGARM